MRINKRLTGPELNRLAHETIARELGPAVLAQYIIQNFPGSGDYTKLRHEWLPDTTVDELADEIERWKKEQGDAP